MKHAGIALFCLWMAACNEIDTPPSTSYSVETAEITADGVSRTVRAASVTPVFFPAAKALPLLGRRFLPEEHSAGRDNVVVLSNQLWQQSFNSDPRFIGSKVRLNGRELMIVGVMPSKFQIPPGADVWIPKEELNLHR
jgi:MacB-like periplasmic core domain